MSTIVLLIVDITSIRRSFELLLLVNIQQLLRYNEHELWKERRSFEFSWRWKLKLNMVVTVINW